MINCLPLIREGLDMAKFQLELWGACDKVLSHQFVSSNHQILRGCWNVWTVLQTQGSSHAPNKYGNNIIMIIAAISNLSITALVWEWRNV